MRQRRIIKYKLPEDGFRIKSLSDVDVFIEKALYPMTYTFDDVNDKTMYYSICKGENGEISLGHNPIDTSFGILDTHNVHKRMYQARKSINSYFFKD